MKSGATKDYEADGHSIWSCAYVDGRRKYENGHEEHKSKFWTAGALWYANNLRSEALDAVAYSHHLIVCLNRVLNIAMKLEDKEIGGVQGGADIRNILENLPIAEEGK